MTLLTIRYFPLCCTDVCCQDTFVPPGWISDLCVVQFCGERCGTTDDDECAGNLKCAKNNKNDEKYVCCDKTYVPSGWTTEVCNKDPGTVLGCFRLDGSIFK